MKRIKLGIMLILCCDGIFAGWEQVGADDKAYIFADRTTIQKEGTQATMRHLLDFKLRPPENGTNYQSVNIEVRYDCKANRFQDLSASFHPYRMGEGKVLYSVTVPGEWQPIPRARLGETPGAMATLCRMACFFSCDFEERNREQEKSKKQR